MNKLIQLGNLNSGSYKFANPTVGRVYSTEGLSPTINTCQGGQRQPMILIDDEINNESYKIRKLTPKECWRLQGFTDEDFDKAKSAGISNNQLYKQAGNSVCVDVLYYIYKQLYKAMPYLFKDLKVASFFSGIGAFEKGLDKLYEDISEAAV